MKIGNILNYLNNLYPENLALDFDNVGLLLGNKNQECSNIVLCLDITNDCINYAIKHHSNLIISHHPMMFYSFKRINYDSMLVGNKIHKLIENKICVYAMHTNFDIHPEGMNAAVNSTLRKNLDFDFVNYIETFNINDDIIGGVGSILKLKKSISFNKLVHIFDSTFKINSIRGYNSNKSIKQIAICPGSGKSEVNKIINEKVDCFISSDLPHDQILDLLESNISYIDATHEGLENCFVPCIYNKINQFNNKLKIYKYV